MTLAEDQVAFWAGAMFWSNILIIFVTGLGVYYVARTLGATATAANAGLEAAEAASEANELARRSQRAWMSITSIEAAESVAWRDNTGALFEFEFTYKNIGKTPAIKVNIDAKIIVDVGRITSEMENKHVFDDNNTETVHDYIVVPGEERSRNIKIIAPMTEILAAAKRMNIDNWREYILTFFLVGRVRYQLTVDDGWRFTEFAYLISKETGRALDQIFWGNHIPAKNLKLNPLPSRNFLVNESARH